MATAAEIPIKGGNILYFTVEYALYEGGPAQTMSAPLMEIRESAAVTSTKLARFDLTGTQEGTLVLANSNTQLQVSMSAANTAALALLSGQGYFDIFATVASAGGRICLAEGVARIVSHVTATS